MFSLSCFVAAAILVFLLGVTRTRRAMLGWKVLAVLASVSCIAGIVLWPGALPMKRGLAALIMPLGVIWLGLIALVILAWRRNQRGLQRGLLAILLILTVSGNRPLSKMVLDYLEGPYQHLHPLENNPCDTVFLLGGGGGRGPDGQINVSSSGDRVVLAARLYHAGKAPRLVCMGLTSSPYWPVDRNPGTLSFLLLQGLGVPESAMLKLGGRTTKEEMRAIKVYLQTNVVQSAGLVTSAWHMKRAIRLATAEGLHFRPLPGDFRGGRVHWRDYSLIPESGALHELSMALKEIAGVWITELRSRA